MYKEHSLFPRSNTDLAAASYKIIRQILDRERTARQHGCRLNPAKRARQIGEIDIAIGELNILYRLAVENKR